MRLMQFKQVAASVIVSAAACAPVFAATDAQTPWDELVEKTVANGRVDYAAAAQDRPLLSAYLVSIREASPASLSRPKQLAFWINAYNACVFKAVLDHPGIKSVKEVRGFFDKLTYRVAGRDLTLNEIENAGRALGDWRVHFAVVCASASCPPIRAEAYSAEWLDAQLTDQAKAFMNNRKDGIRVEGSTLFVSPIFKWYAKDFIPDGKVTAQALIQLLTPYLSTDLINAAQGKKLSLKFIDYNWSLNSQSKPRG